VLDFSKIEAGRLTLEYSDVRIRDVVEDTVELVHGRAASSGVEFIADVTEEADLIVRGDETRIRQILINLAGNAVKFTHNGEISISVSVRDKQLRFEVSDSGIGIRDENQQAIFEAFSQEDGTTTRKYGGTGLGLAICRQLVGLMQGQIGVQSTYGTGSTFWFEIPFDEARPAVAADSGAELSGLRILVVDDNQLAANSLLRRLRTWGIEASSVAGAAEALHALQHAADDPFDAVLIDLGINGANGITLAEQVAANSGAYGPKLVLLSNTAIQQAFDSARSVSIAAWISKPVRHARLKDSLSQCIARTPETDAPDAAATGVTLSAQRLLGVKVLLVEDNIVNQEVAKGMLGFLGCEYEIASNGEEAVGLVQQKYYDVVFMDCQMPVMDGFQATQAIRAAETGTTRHQIIVALTANAMAEDHEKSIRAGMDDHMTKPFMVADLNRVLRQWCTQQVARIA
jgi:CheY-like chemotaxis protein/anti-sigma regulatory factor (Ser/Thr protein kinase)